MGEQTGEEAELEEGVVQMPLEVGEAPSEVAEQTK